MLELTQVVKHYHGASELVRAVDGVSLCVQPGEFTALRGPSGSGKTTLLLLAATVLRPDRGSVQLGGRDLSGLAQDAAARLRRREIGFIFQSFHLIGAATALDNAAVKLLADGCSLVEARRQAEPWLERVGLATRADHTPAQLSAGERQRVAIARALVGDPRLILADEPTGSLDSRRGADILALLRDLAHERAIPVLLVTHDSQAGQFVDRTELLRDGRLMPGNAAPIPSELVAER